MGVLAALSVQDALIITWMVVLVVAGIIVVRRDGRMR